MSNEPTIEMINEAIAVFDGWEVIKGKDASLYKKDGKVYALGDFKYHSSWDWLMPVWKKAGEIIYAIRGDLREDDYIMAHRTTKSFLDACQNGNIKQAHKVVFHSVQFIQWYNKQKEVNNE
jgi:hypothetical protein